MSKLTVALTALVAAAGTMAAAPGVSAAAAPQAATAASWSPAPIAWGACSNATLVQAHAQCGTLSVPLDYGNPSGTKIQLAVSRVQHTVAASQYQGVMLTNPGGPGGSGLTLAVLGGFVPGGAGQAYDWIGFDPRGVGSSKPALSCDPSYFDGPRPPYEPLTKSIQNAWLAKSADYARDCGRSGGALLGHLTTRDTVADMDSLRKALGATKLSFYGYSYGTYLGQVYATLHPDRVRRMVLDSNINPHTVWYQGNLDQDTAFEKVLAKWFAWVARYDSTYHLGTTAKAVEDRWYEVKDKLRFNPAGNYVGSAEWVDIFLGAGYVQFLWPDLAALFSGWVTKPDAQKLIDAYKGAVGVGDDNGYAIYLAVQCGDAPWPHSWSTWQRDNTRIAKQAPFLTWANAWYNAPCRAWPAPSHTPVRVDGGKAPPILLIDETLDAATPYAGSLATRRLFPHASLIALPGGTNHAFSLSGNSCLDTKIAAYLRDGTLPTRKSGNGADATCAPLPTPVPSAASSSSPGGGATRLIQQAHASLLR